MALPPGTDPKRRIGAYLALWGRTLVEVIGLEDDQVLVQNSRTEFVLTLDADELADARLITPAPDEMAAFEEAALIPDAPDPTSAAPAPARHASGAASWPPHTAAPDIAPDDHAPEEYDGA